mmetsp:Transcript_39057/g.34745  ORF Transcript_39057/g.34745 Transcript_39057/m.34745 type:complete len:83 (+) Transcript_39057:312-560(+)
MFNAKATIDKDLARSTADTFFITRERRPEHEFIDGLEDWIDEEYSLFDEKSKIKEAKKRPQSSIYFNSISDANHYTRVYSAK